MKQQLMLSACAFAMLAGTAHAQSAASADASSETSTDNTVSEIVVTGSRAVVDGTRAPTPVTVVSSEQIAKGQPGLIGEGLNQLPAFRGSVRPSTGFTSATGPGSGSYLNLRNLGAQRTLVLVDGRRAAPSNRDGSSDVNLIPEALLKRVDVVTGGASAAYGSDAVAGVVNFVLDTRLRGLRLSAQAGISDKGDGASEKFSIAGGTAFAGDRGHVIGSFTAYNVDGIQSVADRDWGAENWGFIANPAVAGQLIFRSNLHASTASAGGLVLSGPFALQQFLPGGALGAFSRGTLQSGLNQIGGDGAQVFSNLTASISTQTAFGRADYDLTPNLNLFAQLSAGQGRNRYVQVPQFSLGGFNGFTIFSGNAFLSSAAQGQLTSTSTPAFTMGRINYDFGAPPTALAVAQTVDFTTGFEWKAPAGITVNGYYEHGSNSTVIRTLHNVNLQNLYAAADAVLDTSTNSIVCRVSQTNPGLYPGCVPINLFGAGSPSQAAIDYVSGDSRYRMHPTQDVISLSARAQPFSTWAGPVSVAFGGEYRREVMNQTTDAIGPRINTATGIRGFPAAYQNQPGGWLLTNVFPISGAYNLWEGFGEVAVPLARDLPLAKALDVNGAVRYTNYSTSGGVTTWKVGGVWEPVDSIRFRGTVSQDIRAPNVPELFSGINQATSSVIENGVTVPIITATSGNPALQPEKAKTYTGGVVLTPSMIPGLSVSVDYYKIDIEGVISSLNAQTTLNQCAAGATQLCANIVRNSSGAVTRITSPTLNLNSLSTSGYDFEVAYRPQGEVFGGQLGLRAVVGYLGKYEITTFGASVIDRAGEVAAGGTVSANPHLIITASADWSRGPLELFVQERVIGKGKFDNTKVEPTTIEQNDVASIGYTDITATYAIKPDIKAFITVNNLFDKDPPLAPTGTLVVFNRTNPALYDVIGRYFTAGVKMKF